MEKIEGIIVTISWDDRFSNNSRKYIIDFSDNDIDEKVLINHMKKHTRLASKDASLVVSVFVERHYGFGKEADTYARFNLGLLENDFSIKKMAYDENHKEVKKESIKHESIYDMVNNVFEEVKNIMKEFQKQKKGKNELEINGWKLKTSSEVVSITDDKGINHKATKIRQDKVLIEKQGTTRVLRYPKFVIEFVEEHFGKTVINKSK
jgi:hypothetical protein